ncbi:LOW QUALITY PROTEIN: growth hormone receptor a [Onychostoma macrolepis]|uniref:LOW QUALITY PROTEIN: growth hormone receptor a n=1 Tax=Onychostoma macrolepis TaxID=369639 RepID=UPI00272D6027|nr:LOW QUALITY PROTEIN: growth hormone receptor a [Onychostoma macrolepis]
MACSLLLGLLYLGLLCGNGLVSARSELFTPDPSRGPHFTGCRSREQETFRCWWSTGIFQNLNESGALRVFYQTKNALSEWQECPDYTRTVKNECYFNKTFTHIWTSYCIQLRSVRQNITYDEACFTVENIVHPDPPIGLNWTLLNVSRSGLHFDILVRWAPPPSADVQMGWMSLVYQVQYRVRNASHWEMLDLESGTQQSIYGLHTDKEYEVRVRCKMSAFDNFGEFSDSIIVHVAQIPSKESTFPMTLVLIFGVIGLVILLVLLIFSQQQRLMVIFLPPIPAPKIKGIDPELLKNGKLDQLNSLLSSQDMYKPDFYHEDPWVEFIQLDLDDPAEKNESSDTQHLLGLSRSGSSHVLNFKSDDDSGRASCYDPEIPNAEDLASLLPGHSGRGDNHPLVSRSSSSIPDLGVQQTSEVEETPIQTQPAVPSWVNMDFYAQVSDFTPAGGVVLSPGQLNSSPEKKKEEENEKKIQFQLVSDGAYTSENTARQLSADVPPSPGPEQGYQTFPTQAIEGNLWNGEYLVSTSDSQTPYLLPEAPPAPILPPVSDYTVAGSGWPAQPPPESSFLTACDMPSQPKQTPPSNANHAHGVPHPRPSGKPDPMKRLKRAKFMVLLYLLTAGNQSCMNGATRDRNSAHEFSLLYATKCKKLKTFLFCQLLQ